MTGNASPRLISALRKRFLEIQGRLPLSSKILKFCSRSGKSERTVIGCYKSKSILKASPRGDGFTFLTVRLLESCILMNSFFSCLSVVVVLLIGFATNAQAGIVSVFVPGFANPYLAGMPNGTTAPFGDTAPQQSPLLIVGLDINQASYLSFSATGSASYNNSSFFGPDGGFLFSRGAENGISGLRVTVSALIGVFLDSRIPTTISAPNDLDFEVLTRDFLTLSPKLKQVFFIGDGMTGSEVTQKFYVPKGATRLFLGTADGTQWVNNAGGFNTNITSHDQAAIPEPASMVIFGLGAIGFAYRNRRKFMK